MNITVQSYKGLTVVVAQGLLSKGTFSELNEKVKNAPVENAKQVWFDGTRIHRIQLTQTCFSSFINKLLALHKQGVQVVLFGLSGSIQHMLRLLRLDTLFLQVPTLEDAYLLLSKHPKNVEAVTG